MIKLENLTKAFETPSGTVIAAEARAVAPISVRRVHENARSLFMHSSFPNDAAEADVAC